MTPIVRHSADAPTKTEERNNKIKIANAIILVYDSASNDSYEKINTVWIPLISFLNKKSKITIAANKVDTTDFRQVGKDLQSLIFDLCKSNRQVEIGMECNILSQEYIDELFINTIKSVIYPVDPLCNKDTHKLTDEYTKCLLRVFRLSDTNNDGYLDDDEFTVLQREAFQQDISKETIFSIKKVLGDYQGSKNDHLEKYGISFDDFVRLNALLLKRSKAETNWHTLEHFGYDMSLNLKRSYITKMQEGFKHRHKIYQFTHTGIELLRNVYSYCKDQFPEYTLEDLTDHWTLRMNANYSESYIDLLYMGCPYALTTIIKCADMKKKSIYLYYVTSDTLDLALQFIKICCKTTYNSSGIYSDGNKKIILIYENYTQIVSITKLHKFACDGIIILNNISTITMQPSNAKVMTITFDTGNLHSNDLLHTATIFRDKISEFTALISNQTANKKGHCMPIMLGVTAICGIALGAFFIFKKKHNK